jgi:polysaccharide biosynthesis transport protein
MHEEPVAENEVSFREYLDLLRRRKAIIISTFVAALFIGVAAVLISRPVYRSTGRLLVAPNNPTMMMRDAGNDPLNYIGSQRQLHNIETQLQVLLTPQLIANAYQAVNLPATDPRAKVNVERVNDEVDIIDVIAEAHNPAIAAGIANNLMNLYIAQDEEWRNGDIKTSIKYAEKELEASNRRWNNDQIALTNYRRKEQITDFVGQIQSQTQQVAGLKARRDQTQQELDSQNKMLDVTMAQLARLDPTISKKSIATNMNIEKMREDMMTARAEYDGILALYKPDHPKAKAIKTRLDALEAALKKAPNDLVINENTTNPELREVQATIRKMQATRAGLITQLATVSSQHDQAEKRLNNLGQRQYTLAKLDLNAQQSQQHLMKIRDRLDDLKLRDVAKTHPITVLTAARAEPDPVRPRKVMMLGMAAFAGLFLGVCSHCCKSSSTTASMPRKMLAACSTFRHSAIFPVSRRTSNEC